MICIKGTGPGGVRMKVLGSLLAQAVIFVGFSASGAIGSERVIGRWAVVETKDVMDDTPSVQVQTPLDARIRPWFKLACEHGHPFLYFGLPHPAAERGDVKLTLRAGGGTPWDALFTSLGDSVVAAGLSASTYEKLLTTDKIAIRQSLPNGAAADFVIPLAGIKRAADPMLRACPMSSTLAAQPSSAERALPETSQTPQNSPTKTAPDSTDAKAPDAPIQDKAVSAP